MQISIQKGSPSVPQKTSRLSLVWQRQPAVQPALQPTSYATGGLARLYKSLLEPSVKSDARQHALQFLQQQLNGLDDQGGSLPDEPESLIAWMQHESRLVSAQYSTYLAERKAGAPRRYFTSHAHALYFLRSVAPTKLVDGAWLYGLAAHWRNPRLADLVRTYLEELGDGDLEKNHVALYRKLLTRLGGVPQSGLDDSLYAQGVVQLALALHADAFLPEIIGFNLGYEQLPLHLLITAYELNELGLDPYYFTLHVTVDNADTGHGRRAVDAVMANLPQLGGTAAKRDFWHRVQRGLQLGNAGIGSTDVIKNFDIEREVIAIFSRKSAAGFGVHSDYCRVAGRSINEWLSDAAQVPDFLAALQKSGWIKLGEDVRQSRFWGLLQGQSAEMFGVFNDYELQMIHDWIRGPEASSDGRAYAAVVSSNGGGGAASTRPATFRASARSLARASVVSHASDDDNMDDAKLAKEAKLAEFVGEVAHQRAPQLLDTDLPLLDAALKTLDANAREALLIAWMAPSRHWTPAGLKATRLFCAMSQA